MPAESAVFGRTEIAVKIWLFALLQSLIAVVGLGAWFYADNALIAGGAAIAAAGLGVFQPLYGAWKHRQREEWADGQRKKTLDIVDSHIDSALEEVIAPPMPHRPTVAAFLRLAGLGDPDEQLQRYDDVVKLIDQADGDCADEAAAFCVELMGNVLGVTLEGLAALALGRHEDALKYFREATLLHSGWALPWLGWATVCYEQGKFEELAAKHPHINGVELLCYDCGDEDVFMELSPAEREGLSALFQQTATALGNYYAAAEMAKSRQQQIESHEEYRRVA